MKSHTLYLCGQSQGISGILVITCSCYQIVIFQCFLFGREGVTCAQAFFGAHGKGPQFDTEQDARRRSVSRFIPNKKLIIKTHLRALVIP